MTVSQAGRARATAGVGRSSVAVAKRKTGPTMLLKRHLTKIRRALARGPSARPLASGRRTPSHSTIGVRGLFGPKIAGEGTGASSKGIKYYLTGNDHGSIVMEARARLIGASETSGSRCTPVISRSAALFFDNLRAQGRSRQSAPGCIFASACGNLWLRDGYAKIR